MLTYGQLLDVRRHLAFYYDVPLSDVNITKTWENNIMALHIHDDACERLTEEWWSFSWRLNGRPRFTCQVRHFDYLAHDCANGECVARYLVEYMYSAKYGGCLHVSDCGLIGIRQD